jgi:hypothetical protein
MPNKIFKLLVGLVVSLFISQAYGQSCSFKTQIKYQDGSIGCIEDLPFANEVLEGENYSVADKVSKSSYYVVAISKDNSCKAIGLFTQTGFAGGINQQGGDHIRDKAMDRCQADGCKCQVAIAYGNARVPKAVLMAQNYSAPDNPTKKTKELTNIKPSQAPKESSCSFKTQIKYQDGTVGCIDDLPMANQIPRGGSQSVIDSISGANNYYIAASNPNICQSLGISTYRGTQAGLSPNLLKKQALDSCKSNDCECNIVISDGNALVSKDVLLVAGPLSPPSKSTQSVRAADSKPSQNVETSSIRKANSAACNEWNILRFADGSQGCMTDYKFFTLPNSGTYPDPYFQNAKGKKDYAIALVKNPNMCKGHSRSSSWNEPAYKAVQYCEKSVKERLQKDNKDSDNCECELIFSNEFGDKANVPMSKTMFEDKTRAWLGAARNNPTFKDQFTAEEREANAKFFAEYVQRLNSEDKGEIKLAPTPVVNNLAQQKTTDEKERAAEANRLKQEEALKSATAQEKLKLELVQKQKEQQELAKKQQLEKEQKLAEEKRAQQELAKQQQLEKEQKLVEQKRLQAEMAAKAQTEKEQKLAEEKRKQDEFVAKIQAEKEQKELALRQKKEADQQAQAQLAVQAPKASYVGKRLALVIGNSKYTQRPLDNAVNDANDVSKALKNTGFEVIDVRDATLSQMRTALRQFGDKLLNNDVGLVYYSGHGVEVKGRNYFIPVNADIKRSDEIADQSLDVGLVLDKMETAQKAVNILIVDACRDDPFGRSFRSGSRGLATMDAPQGTIIAFATSPGKVAADGDGRNSPYTKNLVVAMQEPNLPIEQVFKQVRRAVQKETKGQQTPWENTSLSGDFYFKVQK